MPIKHPTGASQDKLELNTSNYYHKYSNSILRSISAYGKKKCSSEDYGIYVLVRKRARHLQRGWEIIVKSYKKK